MDKTKITQQLLEAEQHLEKVKAELYSTIGKIATLKDFLADDGSVKTN